MTSAGCASTERRRYLCLRWRRAPHLLSLRAVSKEHLRQCLFQWCLKTEMYRTHVRMCNCHIALHETCSHNSRNQSYHYQAFHACQNRVQFGHFRSNTSRICKWELSCRLILNPKEKGWKLLSDRDLWLVSHRPYNSKGVRQVGESDNDWQRMISLLRQYCPRVNDECECEELLDAVLGDGEYGAAIAW